MTSKKVNILACLLSFILGVGFGVGGYGIADKIHDKQTEPKNQIEVTDNGGAVVNNAAENGIRLMSEKLSPVLYAANGVSETAESAYTITATVLPEDASNKNLTWELSFKNDSSSWANGKNVTDYVTVTSSGDTNNVVVLSCDEAFGEQILLKATSVADNTKSATVTIDYVKRLLSVDMALSDGTELIDYKTLVAEYDYSDDSTYAPKVSFDFGNDEELTLEPTFTQGVGTIDGGYSITSATMDINPLMLAGLGKTPLKLSDFRVKYYASSGTTDLTSGNPIDVLNGVVFGKSLFTHFFGDLSTKDQVPVYINQFFSNSPTGRYMNMLPFVDLGKGFFIFDVTISSNRNTSDGNLVSYNYQYSVMVEDVITLAAVSDVNTDKSGVIY